MRADQDRSTRATEIPLASTFMLGELGEHAVLDGDECPAPEFVSQLVDVSQELADVIASANADLE